MSEDNPHENDPEYIAMKERVLAFGKREANDWINIMKNDSGRRVIIQLLNQCGYMRSVFDKHNSEMSRNVGKSEIGFFIQGMLSQHVPDALTDIMTNQSNLFANDH